MYDADLQCGQHCPTIGSAPVGTNAAAEGPKVFQYMRTIYIDLVNINQHKSDIVNISQYASDVLGTYWGATDNSSVQQIHTDKISFLHWSGVG